MSWSSSRLADAFPILWSRLAGLPSILRGAIVDARSVDGPSCSRPSRPSRPSLRSPRSGPTSAFSTRARNRPFCSSSKRAKESNLSLMRSSTRSISVMEPEVEGFGSPGARIRAFPSQSRLESSSSSLASRTHAPFPAREGASAALGLFAACIAILIAGHDDMKSPSEPNADSYMLRSQIR